MSVTYVALVHRANKKPHRGKIHFRTSAKVMPDFPGCIFGGNRSEFLAAAWHLLT